MSGRRRTYTILSVSQSQGLVLVPARGFSSGAILCLLSWFLAYVELPQHSPRKHRYARIYALAHQNRVSSGMSRVGKPIVFPDKPQDSRLWHCGSGMCCPPLMSDRPIASPVVSASHIDNLQD